MSPKLLTSSEVLTVGQEIWGFSLSLETHFHLELAQVFESQSSQCRAKQHKRSWLKLTKLPPWCQKFPQDRKLLCFCWYHIHVTLSYLTDSGKGESTSKGDYTALGKQTANLNDDQIGLRLFSQQDTPNYNLQQSLKLIFFETALWEQLNLPYNKIWDSQLLIFWT